MNARLKFLTLAVSILSLAIVRAEDIFWGKDLTLNGEPLGEALDLASLEGKHFIIYWGCINCGRCAVQVDDFARMAKSLEKKGVPVIAVQSTDVSDEAVNAHIKKHRLKVPYYPTNKRVSLMTSNPGLHPLFRGIPRYIIFDGDGKMAGYYGNAANARKAVEKMIK